MIRRYGAGYTLEEIAVAFGISPGRVGQLFDQADLPRRSRDTRARLHHEQQRLAPNVVSLFKASGDVEAVATRTGLSGPAVRRVLKEALGQPSPYLRRSPRRRYGDPELRNCLLAARKVLGEPLTAAAYDRLARSSTLRDGRP